MRLYIFVGVELQKRTAFHNLFFSSLFRQIQIFENIFISLILSKKYGNNRHLIKILKHTFLRFSQKPYEREQHSKNRYILLDEALTQLNANDAIKSWWP